LAALGLLRAELASRASSIDHRETVMSSRALTLALRLLTAACAGAALGSLTGCPFFFNCPEPWSEVQTLELGSDADMLAIARGGDYDELIAVGVGGVVVHYDDEGPSISNPTNVTLRGVVGNGPTVVVGDDGIISSSEDRGASWTPRVSGTSEDLLGVTYASLDAGFFHVAISSGQVLYSSDGAQTWTIVTPPAEGWGGLRAVFSSGDQVFVIGDGGSAWATDNPAGAWLAQDLGTTDALIGGGRVSGDDASSYNSAIAVVTSTQVLWRDAGTSEWTTIDVELDGAIAAFGGGFVVTVNGSVYDLTEGGLVERVANVGLTPLAITGGWDGFVVVGEGGNAARAYFQECVGGRPWVIDGEPATAKLVRGARAWSGEVEPAGELAPDLRELLVAAWARDGQFEHASVASFARFVSELMHFGAPPELILASRMAIADELDHARRCFALASRYAGNSIGPGPLPLPRAGARAGERELVEFAMAVFEEGCINESVAAAEAAIAAAECSDAQVRETLERIAADEREHAALAWKTLRWLLDSHAPVLAPALRRQLVSVGAPLTRARPGEPPGALELRLRDHGRLPADERAAIQRKVFAELILPLSRELLGGSMRAQA
jgi:photosystem II stability/assembly factor-like uncharacterized protein